MKKITLIIILALAMTNAHSQNYQISFGGTGASTAVDSVKVENLTQCKDTSLLGSDILHLVVTVGINDVNENPDNTLHIYPNPMTDNCVIEFETSNTGMASIELYDLTGNKIRQEQSLLMKGFYTYNISGISSGIYLIKIASAGYFYSSKIVCLNETAGTVEIKPIEHRDMKIIQDTDNDNRVSDTDYKKSSKSGKTLIEMQYTTGDRLKFTGYSGGIYRTINMLVPTNSQTVTFDFVDCTDGDGNHYAVVKIGTQVWMAENLKTTKYKNATAIPLVTGNTEWSDLSTPGYCWYNNDQATYGIIYGALYNWYTVNTGNLAPTGWHVPTDAEWTTLTTYLGGEIIAGGKLKETCSSLWYSPNEGATNETGLTALPGGFRDGSNGTFGFVGYFGLWWSATESDTDDAWYRDMFYNFSDVSRNSDKKGNGFSVRCIRD